MWTPRFSHQLYMHWQGQCTGWDIHVHVCVSEVREESSFFFPSAVVAFQWFRCVKWEIWFHIFIFLTPLTTSEHNQVIAAHCSERGWGGALPEPMYYLYWLNHGLGWLQLKPLHWRSTVVGSSVHECNSTWERCVYSFDKVYWSLEFFLWFQCRDEHTTCTCMSCTLHVPYIYTTAVA